MAVLTRDELFDSLHTVLGDSTSDDSIKLLEDVTDTYNDMVNRTQDTTDWKAKYEALDEQWKQKYKRRFFNSPVTSHEDEADKPEKVTAENIQIDDLFK